MRAAVTSPTGLARARCLPIPPVRIAEAPENLSLVLPVKAALRKADTVK